MRAVASADLSLADRLTVEVDPDADPVDWDQALAVFLLKFVRKQAIRSAGTAAAEPVEENTSAEERHRG